MNIVSLLVALIILGFVCWMLYSAPIPMHPWFKNLIAGIIFIAVLIWILNLLGLNTGINLRLK